MSSINVHVVIIRWFTIDGGLGRNIGRPIGKGIEPVLLYRKNEGLEEEGSFVLPESNFEERHVERIFAEVMKIHAVADSSDGKIKRPLNRILAVRICSRLGIENSVGDGKTGSIVADSEHSLFGHIYPVLELEPFHCKYYAAWLRRKAGVRRFIEGLDLDRKGL